ncbi:trypsin 3A1-like [Topomyia yanbarensis]|uniref:trypsin 3A1-like n=1 Tax=Topomyia yanbarensis TaxID=2498891 RepID=UPI00273B02B0|nr:trypsin 3A1-like [Topomyia yanbarensis]
MAIQCDIVFLLLLSFSVIPHIASKTVSGGDWRIINGRNGSIEEIPHIVSIQRNDTHWCGGTILTTYWILSAARCVPNIDVSELTALVGQTSQRSKSNSVHTISNYLSHPDYSANRHHDNDIAVVKLSTSLRFSKSVQPVRLPPVCSEVDNHGMLATVAGWGRANDTYMPENLNRRLLCHPKWGMQAIFRSSDLRYPDLCSIFSR